MMMAMMGFGQKRPAACAANNKGPATAAKRRKLADSSRTAGGGGMMRFMAPVAPTAGIFVAAPRPGELWDVKWAPPTIKDMLPPPAGATTDTGIAALLEALRAWVGVPMRTGPAGVLVAGRSGTGKTLSVRLACESLGIRLVSADRDVLGTTQADAADQLQSLARAASRSFAADGTPTPTAVPVLLVDNVHELSEDMLAAVLALVATPAARRIVRILCVATCDASAMDAPPRLCALVSRRALGLVPFVAPAMLRMTAFLAHVWAHEHPGVPANTDTLRDLAMAGDVRAALTAMHARGAGPVAAADVIVSHPTPRVLLNALVAAAASDSSSTLERVMRVRMSDPGACEGLVAANWPTGMRVCSSQASRSAVAAVAHGLSSADLVTRGMLDGLYAMGDGCDNDVDPGACVIYDEPPQWACVLDDLGGILKCVAPLAMVRQGGNQVMTCAPPVGSVNAGRRLATARAAEEALPAELRGTVAPGGHPEEWQQRARLLAAMGGSPDVSATALSELAAWR